MIPTSNNRKISQNSDETSDHAAATASHYSGVQKWGLGSEVLGLRSQLSHVSVHTTYSYLESYNLVPLLAISELFALYNLFFLAEKTWKA